MIEILRGDCRDVLVTLEAAQFDCCIADPPYGDTSLVWDEKVTGWLEHTSRVLKPNSSLWVFGSLRFLAALFNDVEAAGFKYSQDIVWEKQNGTGFHNDRFRRVHEHAVLFYRGRWADVYKNPQYTLDARKKVVRRKTRPAHTGYIDRGHYVSEDGGPRLARSVLQVRNEHGRALHPTQKPEGIVEPLMLYSCPPEGKILDPFFGSGTTGVVAQRHGLNLIGIERDEKYFQIAQQRLGLAALSETTKDSHQLADIFG